MEVAVVVVAAVDVAVEIRAANVAGVAWHYGNLIEEACHC